MNCHSYEKRKGRIRDTVVINDRLVLTSVDMVYGPRSLQGVLWKDTRHYCSLIHFAFRAYTIHPMLNVRVFAQIENEVPCQCSNVLLDNVKLITWRMTYII